MPWFETLPLDWSDSTTQSAEAALRKSYNMSYDILHLAQNAGLDVGALNQQLPPNLLLRNVLDAARQSDRLLRVFVEVLRDQNRAAIHDDVRKLFVGHEHELSKAAMANKPSLAVLATLPPTADIWLADDESATSTTAAAGFEKMINAAGGISDLAVFRKALATAEVRTAQIEIGGKAKGTGFLVADDLLLTNWHVAVQVGDNGAVAHFDKKVSANGDMLAAGRKVDFAKDWKVAHSDHEPYKVEASADGPPQGNWDYALVRLAEKIGEEKLGTNKDGEKRGCYRLDGGHYDFDEHEPLLIVGHPESRPLAFSYANPAKARLTKHANRVRYHTNTDYGSSGSPVFNREWRIVALHHASGPTPKPGPFTTNTKEFNQGMPISGVVKSLQEKLAGTPVLAELGLA